MSALVLLKLLNKLSKRDKNARLAKNFISFPSKFNKFNNTGARMLDSIYQMSLKILSNHIFGMKISIF